MSDVVLIHGYATGLNVSIFRTARGAEAGFLGFAKLVERGVAKPFRWDRTETLSFWRALSPMTYLSVYRNEREQIRSEETHAALEAFLRAEQPRVVVCHSMGCALLLAYLERHSLPKSVRHVVMIQADVPNDARIPGIGDVALHNLYCPWDPTLFASMLYHRAVRAGQSGLPDERARNRLTPLIGWNPHTASIGDPRIAVWTESLR